MKSRSQSATISRSTLDSCLIASWSSSMFFTIVAHACWVGGGQCIRENGGSQVDSLRLRARFARWRPRPRARLREGCPLAYHRTISHATSTSHPYAANIVPIALAANCWESPRVPYAPSTAVVTMSLLYASHAWLQRACSPSHPPHRHTALEAADSRKLSRLPRHGQPAPVPAYCMNYVAVFSCSL
jgi:hypothetical protein